MAGAVTTALIRHRGQLNTTRARYEAIRAAGGGISSMLGTSDAMGQLGTLRDVGANRQRYALYRGWVHSAIHALACEGAGQPAQVGRMAGGKDKGKKPGGKKYPQRIAVKAAADELEIIADHGLLDALEHPNQVQGRWQFVYTFVANLCLTGWGYVFRDDNSEGKPEFFSVPTSWVRPDHKGGAFSKFYIVNPNDNTSEQDSVPYTREQVAFAYIPNPADPLSALAPAAAQANAIRIDEFIQSSQNAFFGNGIFPSALVYVGKNPHPDVPGGVAPRLTPVQRRQVYAAIRKVVGGISNYGNPAILDGMIEKIERLSATQNEMGWEKSEKTIRSRILSAFGVHPFILGEEMAGSYAQAYIVQDRFCQRVNTFLDMLGIVMTSLAGHIYGEESKLFVWWDECVAKDPSRIDALMEKARARGDIGQNEFRTYLNLPPDEDKVEAVFATQAEADGATKVAEAVTAGRITPEQGVAVLMGRGIPKDIAEDIAGEGPDEDAVAAQQAALAGQQPPTGGQPFGGKPKPKPKPAPKPAEEELEDAKLELEAAMAILAVPPETIAKGITEQAEAACL